MCVVRDENTKTGATMEKKGARATRFQRYAFVHRQYVAWGEMDAFSHVNNVAYARYFENARVELFRQLGSWNEGAALDFGPVIINLNMQYRQQVRYPAELDVTLGITRMKKRSSSFLCSMWQGDVCVHTADADFMWVHFAKGRPVEPPAGLMDALSPYIVRD